MTVPPPESPKHILDERGGFEMVNVMSVRVTLVREGSVALEDVGVVESSLWGSCTKRRNLIYCLE